MKPVKILIKTKKQRFESLVSFQLLGLLFIKFTEKILTPVGFELRSKQKTSTVATLDNYIRVSLKFYLPCLLSCQLLTVLTEVSQQSDFLLILLLLPFLLFLVVLVRRGSRLSTLKVLKQIDMFQWGILNNQACGNDSSIIELHKRHSI